MALFLVASCSYSLRCLPSPAISSNFTSVSTSRAYVVCKWHPPPGFVFAYFPLCLLSPLSSLWRHTPLTCTHQNLHEVEMPLFLVVSQHRWGNGGSPLFSQSFYLRLSYRWSQSSCSAAFNISQTWKASKADAGGVACCSCLRVGSSGFCRYAGTKETSPLKLIR